MSQPATTTEQPTAAATTETTTSAPVTTEATSVGAIIGVVVALLLVLITTAVVVLAVLLVVRNKRKDSYSYSIKNDASNSNAIGMFDQVMQPAFKLFSVCMHINPSTYTTMSINCACVLMDLYINFVAITFIMLLLLQIMLCMMNQLWQGLRQALMRYQCPTSLSMTILKHLQN